MKNGDSFFLQGLRNTTDMANEPKNVTEVMADTSSDITEDSYYSRVCPAVIAMTILFILSAVGNVTVFVTLVTSPLRKTRISIMILHLTIADLVVTFLFIPSEVCI